MTELPTALRDPSARLRHVLAIEQLDPPGDALLVESESNDVWKIGDLFVRVCWRGDCASDEQPSGNTPRSSRPCTAGNRRPAWRQRCRVDHPSTPAGRPPSSEQTSTLSPSPEPRGWCRQPGAFPSLILTSSTPWLPSFTSCARWTPS